LVRRYRSHQRLLSRVPELPSSLRQADVEIDEIGRKCVCYKRYQTSLETLLAADEPAQYMRRGLSINALKRIAGALSDINASRRMQQAKGKLFERLRLAA
jgi:hypothetical protein